ncbi:MAG: ATP-binding protein [Acinetobacter tjernbergiae]
MFAYAQPVHHTTCRATIQSIQLAKASTGQPPPTTGWIHLKTLPNSIESHWRGYSGSVWYQIRFHYHCPNAKHNPLTLAINYINMAGQIYLNDTLLWQDQSLVEPLSRSWNMPRYWNLPASSLKPNQNVLWIQVVGVTTQNSGLGTVLLGTANDIMPKYQLFWNQQRVLMFFNLIFSLTLGIIVFLVWLFHRKDTVFGWFSLTTLAWDMVMTNMVMLQAPFALTTLQIARISILCFFAYSLFSFFYAWRLARLSLPRIEKILLTLLCIAIGLAILLPNTTLSIFIPVLFLTGIFFLIINFVTYPYIAYKSKLLEAYWLAAIFVLFTIVSIHDLFCLMGFTHDFIWAAYTAPLATLFIALILALRLARNVKKIEKFNHILEHNIIQAKDELAISLNAQHQLALDNAKLQERLQLSHDLHDGLGGSLVRSMVTVDQSLTNLSNQQFLSMLKLLRDDLRQIIDSGSSLSAKVPETPILWGAPLRYRFSQLFDELDIHSKWAFPSTWDKKPTPLICLTLFRIAEESLTNILKHSQATSIKCTLIFLHGQLQLNIEDNGIGFDVEAVKGAGMSVGLKSMQTRLEHLGGYLKIESTFGVTHITACLPI